MALTNTLGKQDLLSSGNLKTINNQSLLGEGDLEIVGVTDYTKLENIPFSQVDNNTLVVEDGVMKVQVADDVAEDDTKPITASKVKELVGNIDTLLELI